MPQQKGLTIVQLMIILAIAGIVGWLVVGILVEKRCEHSPASPACTDRKVS